MLQGFWHVSTGVCATNRCEHGWLIGWPLSFGSGHKVHRLTKFSLWLRDGPSHSLEAFLASQILPQDMGLASWMSSILHGKCIAASSMSQVVGYTSCRWSTNRWRSDYFGWGRCLTKSWIFIKMGKLQLSVTRVVTTSHAASRLVAPSWSLDASRGLRAETPPRQVTGEIAAANDGIANQQ